MIFPLGPRPFRWRRPRWRRWDMMTSTKTRRRWWRVSWRMTRLAMRVRSPWRRRGGTPSKPLSRAGPEGPTRGSRATPESTCRWRRRRRVAASMTAGAWGPRSGRALWAQTTFGGTTVLGPCTVWVRTIGSRRPATAGRGVRRHPRATVPSSGAVTGGPLAGTTSSARGAACSFWTGLMLSPWRLSVARGTQLPQCVGAHVPLGNSGTHGWLGWSVTLQLSPIQLHVLEDLCLPLLYYSWRRCLRNCLTRLRGQLERRSGYAARIRLLDKRGAWHPEKIHESAGGEEQHLWAPKRT